MTLKPFKTPGRGCKLRRQGKVVWRKLEEGTGGGRGGDTKVRKMEDGEEEEA